MNTALYTLDSSPQFEWLELSSITSTNDFLRTYVPREKKEMVLVTADYQQQGRGQTGNHWESEYGKNLLFSLLIYPHQLKANQQFILSQAIALSIKETIEQYTPNISIKWPNDIYWEHKKMGGILIENSLLGTHIERCIIGVGININQQRFTSNAPNPVSLSGVVGKEIEIPFILAGIIQRFKSYYTLINQGHTDTITQAYFHALYNKDGFHQYVDQSGIFEASISNIEPSGHIILSDRNGKVRRYAFKEVRHIIPTNKQHPLEL